MQHEISSLITDIRAASRDLVRELGFMSRTLAGTDRSASAVHAIIEIGATGGVSAKQLSEKLLLEKSTVSRLVRSLVERGDVREFTARDDARRKQLALTKQGEKTLAAITRYAERQVVVALAPLEDGKKRAIWTGLQEYAAALKESRNSGVVATGGSRVTIKQGYRPGVIGRIVETHASYYSGQAGFGAAFEAKMASGLADFITRLGSPANAIWYALQDGKIVGSIAIDGEDLAGGNAHLRWFIVDGDMRGTGVGGELIRKAVEFCDRQNFRETQLWTFKGLDAARRLYEKHGFSLAKEYSGSQWGTEMLEQKFVRPGLR